MTNDRISLDGSRKKGIERRGKSMLTENWKEFTVDARPYIALYTVKLAMHCSTRINSNANFSFHCLTL